MASKLLSPWEGELPLFDVSEIYREIRPRVIGREKEIKNILATLKAGRNVVLQGPPGTSKSTILREITKQVRLPLYIVEGSAELTPGKLIGTHNPAKVMAEGYTQDAFDHGPLTDALVTGGFLYLEEFNRLPEDVMNVLLRAMDERRLAIPRVGDLQAKSSFRLIGAMNPFDDVGTERLSRAISDRLCLIELDYQSLEEEVEIVCRVTGVASLVLPDLAVRLIRRTRQHPELNMGSSIRGAIDMVLIARERLQIDGLVAPDDPTLPSDPRVREALLDCAIVALSGKVWVSETSDRKAREIIEEIWNELHRVPVPGLPEGKMAPGKPGPDDDGESLPTAHSPPDAASTPKRRLEGVRRNRPSQERTKAIELCGVAAAQKEYLGDEAVPQVPVEPGDSPHVVLRRGEMRVDSQEREEAKKLATKLALTIPRPQRGFERRRGKFSALPYHHGSSDLDVDRTVERIVGKDTVDYEDFVVRERSREKRSYVLILDVSGSMTGEAILRALVALAAFVRAMSTNDYAIVTFCDQASVLKPIGKRASLRHMIEKVFTVPTAGMTDIASGLEAGLLQLRQSRGGRKVGIILTDGAHNKHSDPFELAKRFQELHVVGVRSPWPAAWRACETLARLGRGEVAMLNELTEIPRAIQSVLRR